MKPLLLVDAKNIMWRAESVMSLSSGGEGTGEPTSAIFGMLNTLLRVTSQFPVRGVVVCWDDWTSRRKRLDIVDSSSGLVTYKGAGSNLSPERLEAINRVRKQAITLRRLFYEADVPQRYSPGWEADDVMATLSAKRKPPVYILSGDQDLYQCVSDTVTVIRPDTLALVTPSTVLERFGVLPRQVALYKAIAGDPSDGYSGCPQVGSVGATRFLQSLPGVNSLEALLTPADVAKVFGAGGPLANINNGRFDRKTASVAEKILDNLPVVVTCEQLARVRYDVPLRSYSAKLPQGRKFVLKRLGRLGMTSLLPAVSRILKLGGVS